MQLDYSLDSFRIENHPSAIRVDAATASRQQFVDSKESANQLTSRYLTPLNLNLSLFEAEIEIEESLPFYSSNSLWTPNMKRYDSEHLNSSTFEYRSLNV